MKTANESDLTGLRLAFAQAQRAREHGNHPFGAVLMDRNGGPLLAAENSVVTQRDVTAHAELNLVRAASMACTAEQLRGSTMYCSGEPCPMCAGAIVWCNVRRVVYGLGMREIYRVAKLPADVPALFMECRAVFSSAPFPVEVIGPLLETEARALHDSFW